VRRLSPALLALLAAGCPPDLDYPVVAVEVSGAVEAVVRVEVSLGASDGAAAADHAAAVLQPAADGTWTAVFDTLGTGTYGLSARATDGAERVLQRAEAVTAVQVGPGRSRFELLLGAVDCDVLGCEAHAGDAACQHGACDPAAGTCVTRSDDEGSRCDDTDECTVSDHCEAGACVGQPLDADGDGFLPPPCAGAAADSDCDDTDATVAAGAPEVCDGKDNDCDGLTDDDLGLGECWGGPAGTQGVGVCVAGVETCDPATGELRCRGEVRPAPELPRTEADEDCDGVADELEVGCLDCGAATLGAAPAALGEGPHLVIVGLVPPAGDAGAAAVAELQDAVITAVSGQAGAGLTPGRRYRLLPGFVAEATPAALDLLLADERVASVVRDLPVAASLAESVPLVGARRVREEAAVTGGGVAIAVVDTGVDYTLEAFGRCDAPGDEGGCRVVAGRDVVDEDDQPLDTQGHGTAVAGAAAGAAIDGCQAGAAPGASLVALRALDPSGRGSASTVLAALDWVLEHHETHGIRVVNVSAASAETFSSPAPCDGGLAGLAFERLAQAGVLVVAAAGGAGRPDGLSWPACASAVLSVGAVYDADVPGRAEHGGCTDLAPRQDQVACFSNGGADLLAPGGPILAPAPGGACREGSGTSLAAALVAGSAALLWSEDPARGRDEVVERLRRGGVLVVDHRSGRLTPRLDAWEARAPLVCVDEDGDGRPEGLRCTRSRPRCAGEDEQCDTTQPGLCALGTTVCRADGTGFCAPERGPVTEHCDGQDDDCDGDTDEEDASGCAPWFRDEDGDGFGTDDVRCLCEADPPYRAERGGDCNDQDQGVNPDAGGCGGGG